MNDTIKWKTVFNGHLKSWHDLFECGKVAYQAGYEFVHWNGLVFQISDEGDNIRRTELKVE